MADSFEGFISTVFQSFTDALQDTKFNQAVGNDFGKMTYPAASYIPENSTYQNQQEYSDTHTVLFVFEKEADHINLKQNIEEMETAVDKVQEELEKNSRVGQFKPTSFDFLVAENSGTRLNVVEVEWTINKLQQFETYS